MLRATPIYSAAFSQFSGFFRLGWILRGMPSGVPAC